MSLLSRVAVGVANNSAGGALHGLNMDLGSVYSEPILYRSLNNYLQITE